MTTRRKINGDEARSMAESNVNGHGDPLPGVDPYDPAIQSALQEINNGDDRPMKKRKVWYPSLPSSDTFRSHLYGSTECRDVVFRVGPMERTFVGHKCILQLRASALYELVLTETERSRDADILLPDIEPPAFEILLRFIYQDTLPEISNNKDDDFEKVKSILCVADRFGCTDLKLYMESLLVDKFISASTAIGLLMLADARSCALLKEACMDAYVTGSKTVTEANTEDWQQLAESNALLVELLAYATSDRKIYAPVVVPNTNNNNSQGNTTTNTETKEEDADNYDVTSLRERLTWKKLDCDGSREILLRRWKE